MAVFRAFIAIELTDEIHQNLDHVTGHLRQSLQDNYVRWVPTKNIHLTLKFLGDVSEANFALLREILQAEAGSHHSFVISVGGLGAFPTIRRPRVIWVGVEAPDELYGIQRGLEMETARLGYAPERRPFAPHLTLGRVSRNARGYEVRAISQLLQTEEVGFLGVTRVNALHLFRSDLSPGGAVYTRLFSAPLNPG